jgi:MOSC domain-containing protein YiiM
MMSVVSIHVGMARTEIRESGQLFTAGVKASVERAELRFDAIVGDGVANRRYHGGPDRTVCVYPAPHYAWWKSAHGHDLVFGAFSENLTVNGLGEAEICIGDVIRIGTALAQVTVPRDPCRTIDRITGITSLHLLARESGKCGFHMRTLEEGVMHVGDPFEVVERNAAGISVASTLDLYHGRSRDRGLVERLLAMPEFADEGKREISRRVIDPLD